MLKKLFNIRKRAAEKVEFFELTAYERGYVHCRRYRGSDVDDAAIRFMMKHDASVVKIAAVNYYGNVVDEYYINA